MGALQRLGGCRLFGGALGAAAGGDWRQARHPHLDREERFVRRSFGSDDDIARHLVACRLRPFLKRGLRVLRRFSIDELPQLINALRGQMSLVGPRPLPLRDYELLEDWHRARYLVLPGMTGLWQISGRSGLSFDDLVRLDFAYLENWSIWLDISIIAKTLPAVLSGRGAY